MPHIVPGFAMLLIAVLGGLALASDTFVYIGSHRHGAATGFQLAHFDTRTGALTIPVFHQEAVAPTYFVLHPDGKFLYTCNSSPDSAVSAYAVDADTAKLTFLNRKPSGGGDPCHVSLNATGRWLMAANYDGGSIAVFALEPDGSIGERTAFAQHTGSSIHPGRQTRAHAHSIQPDSGSRFVLAADLGADKIFVYRFDAKTGALQPNDPPFAVTPPGSGPRHFAFSPNGDAVYVANEMCSSVGRFGWNARDGVLTPFEIVSSLPEGFQGQSTCAEILMHPTGKYLYVTNRGHDSVAVFAVETATGRLFPVQHVPTQGGTPRNCEFDPTAQWLLVSNQDGNNVVVLRINPGTGRLTQNGPPVSVPTPFCIRFATPQPSAETNG